MKMYTILKKINTEFYEILHNDTTMPKNFVFLILKEIDNLVNNIMYCMYYVIYYAYSIFLHKYALEKYFILLFVSLMFNHEYLRLKIMLFQNIVLSVLVFKIEFMQNILS
jgi:hypothetical protein|uniref:Uncharacterized protein n=1 Tax=Sipha flava TaxID=143950 RepID=A0A2S2R730_9HEMI